MSAKREERPASAKREATSSALATYRKKRDFALTPEPPPSKPRPRRGPPMFMVHKHDARRLHYDLRLEIAGALASWAIPKGPSYDPRVRRLAVETEDHPMEYGGFEGRIPEGAYGAGDSIIWDRGVYSTVPPDAAVFMREKGHLQVLLEGEKLHGRWHLVRTRPRGAPGGKPQWLFFKARDQHASETYDVVADRPESVVSGQRATRGPAPAAVQRSARQPIELLIATWPPLLPATGPRAARARALGWWLEGRGGGPRAIAGLAGRRVALQSEAGRDLAGAHPALVAALAALPAAEAVLDGEIAPGGERFVVHDLLWLDGQDLRARTMEERRDQLVALLPPGAAAAVAPAPPFRGPVAEAGRAARRAGWRALLAKKPGSLYTGGPSGDWMLIPA